MANSDHKVKVITVSNGGGKARRAVCSCGALGVRFAYAPASSTAADAKAQADGASHLRGEW